MHEFLESALLIKATHYVRTNFKLAMGYTLTRTQLDENVKKRVNALTAKRRLNNMLVYELDEKMESWSGSILLW